MPRYALAVALRAKLRRLNIRIDLAIVEGKPWAKLATQHTALVRALRSLSVS